MLEIKVVEVRGHCPVHSVGDKAVIDDPKNSWRNGCLQSSETQGLMAE